MEKPMHQPMRSMLEQPKTGWKCDCGAEIFRILLCPECEGLDAHIVGFECIGCDSIHVTPGANISTWEEDEDNVH